MPGKTAFRDMEYLMTLSIRKSLVALLGGMTMAAAGVAVANDQATGTDQPTDPRYNTEQSQPDYNRQGGTPYGDSPNGVTRPAPGTTREAPVNQDWGEDQSDDSDDQEDDRDNGDRRYP